MGLRGFGTGVSAVLLAAWALGSASGASPAKAPHPTTRIRAQRDVVHLPSGEVVELRDHHLEIRSGAVRATAPISNDVDEFRTVDVRADGSMRLVFSRICPPALTMDVGAGWTRARLKAAEANEVAAKDPAQALVKLKEALALDSSQDDLRVEAARVALAANRRDDALAVLKQGIRERPAPTNWAVASEPSLEPLKKDLLGASPAGLFETDDDSAKRTVLWAPGRKWIAVAEGHSVMLLTETGEEVSDFSITTGPDFDARGDILPGALQQVRRRLAGANDALAALGFQKLEGQLKRAEGPLDATRVTFAKPRATVVMRNNVLSLRTGEKAPIAEKKIFNAGSLAIDWAFLSSPVHLLVVSWSRNSGNDECPNESGVAVFPSP